MKHLVAATALALGSQLAGHGALAAEPETGVQATRLGSPANPEGSTKAGQCQPSTAGVISESAVSVQRLIGMRVTNPINEEIGEVVDLIIDECGRVASVVVRVGAFLGLIGGRDVRVSLEAVRIRSAKGSKGSVVMVRQTRAHILGEGNDVGRGVNGE